MFRIRELALGFFLLVQAGLGWGQMFVGASSTGTPNRQEEFALYMRGGYLMSASYYQFFPKAKDIQHLEAVSISALRFSVSGFARQDSPRPSPMVSLGLLDNIAVMTGSMKGEMVTTSYFDLASLTAGYTMPLLDYGAYANIGVKGIVFSQNPLFKTYNALNTEFTYVHAFVEKDTTHSVIVSRPISLATEFFARIGLKVSKNWFASLAAGVRLTGREEGRWFTSNDVRDWENKLNGTDLYTAEEYYDFFYWTDSSLPSQNYFLSGSTLFIHLSISPFY